jgi:hypothetical protein
VGPNVRQQDLDREPLLCDVCDNERLAPSEDEFARRIFHPYHNGATTFEYGEWLPYFAVSLAWRCLLKVEPNTAQQWPQHASSLAAAELAWRAFLLRERTALAPYRHNLFFTSLGAEGEIVPEGLSWYSMRACDMTPVFGRTLAATYISLPGMLFWTYVNPVPRGGWQRIWAYINPLRDRG